MSVIILFASVALTVFLIGVLVVACVVTTRHGDPSAAYNLYSVRDGLIDAVVFKGVSRDNAWLDSLYENVNSVLVHSKLLGGPAGWPLAVAVGQYQAANPDRTKRLRPLPSDDEKCPEPIRVLAGELRQALEHLLQYHMGLHLQMGSREREERRIQHEKAKSLLEMMDQRSRCGSLA